LQVFFWIYDELELSIIHGFRLQIKALLNQMAQQQQRIENPPAATRPSALRFSDERLRAVLQGALQTTLNYYTNI